MMKEKYKNIVIKESSPHSFDLCAIFFEYQETERMGKFALCVGKNTKTNEIYPSEVIHMENEKPCPFCGFQEWFRCDYLEKEIEILFEKLIAEKEARYQWLKYKHLKKGSKN